MSRFVRIVRWRDRELKVSVEEEGSSWRIDAGNGPRNASVLEVEPGVYSVLLDGQSFEIRPADLPIIVEDPRVPRSRTNRAGLEGPQSVVAPMPGKVVRVLVNEGEEVEVGQGLIVIEAMKMQNEMKSPKKGRVVSLGASPGGTVVAGDVLATVE